MESVAYTVVRVVIGGVGVVVALATLSSHLATPELLYDNQPAPPPLAARMPEIVLGVAVGCLLAVPYWWTRQGWLFWPRLAAAVVVGGYFAWIGLRGIAEGLSGQRDPLIIPTGAVFGFAGIALPASLLWHRRRTKRCSRPAGHDGFP